MKGKDMKKRCFFVAAVFLGFALSGCGAPAAKNIGKNYNIEKQPGQAIVIGKVDIGQKGAIGLITSRFITIKKADSDEEIPAPEVGKYFFIPLDEGEYVIDSCFIGFGALGATGYGNTAQLYSRFRARAGKVIYIGNLTVTFRFTGANMTGRGVSVSDQYEEAVNEFRKKYQSIRAEVQKSLIGSGVNSSIGNVDNSWEQLMQDPSITQPQQHMFDAGLQQVGQADEPVGGSLVVVIPTDERLWERWAARGWKPEQREQLVRDSKNELLSMVEAIKKRALFDSVRLQQSDNPEQVSFEEDFALIEPVNQIRQWLLRTREQTAQRVIKLQTVDVSMPYAEAYAQWFIIWLDSVEQAAKNLKDATKE
jgi:hypothetical protein